jgi:hypothetical protein
MRRQMLIRYGMRGLLAVAVALALVLVGLELAEREASEDAAAGSSEPAVLEPVAGTELKRVTLTQSASDRLGLETEAVRSGEGRKLVPYSAVLYDERGRTWVYTATADLTFVRARIEIEAITGDVARLSSGPPVGTRVATVGAAELFGTEFEVDH